MAADLNWDGFLAIQTKCRADGTPAIFEINPRFGGSWNEAGMRVDVLKRYHRALWKNAATAGPTRSGSIVIGQATPGRNSKKRTKKLRAAQDPAAAAAAAAATL